MGASARRANNALERNIEILVHQSLESNGVARGLWKVRFLPMKRSLGYCDYTNRRIVISTAIVGNSKVSFDTAMHEVAHVLAGPSAGHGPNWKKIARQLGATPKPSVEFTDTSNFGSKVEVETNFGKVSAILGVTAFERDEKKFTVVELSKTRLIGQDTRGKLWKYDPHVLHPNCHDPRKVKPLRKIVKTDYEDVEIILGKSNVLLGGKTYVAIDVKRKNVLTICDEGKHVLVPGYLFDPMETKLREKLKNKIR